MWPWPWRTSKKLRVMENETKRGYDLPLTKEKWQFWTLLVLLPLFLLAMEWRCKNSGFGPGAMATVRCAYLLFLGPIVLEFINHFGKLHLVPEGIAITIFGRTIRRFPRENIRFLGGIAYARKSRAYKWICVCCRSRYLLAAEQENKTPKMFRDARTLPGWEENMAGKYLRRYATSDARGMGIMRKDILLIEWSPERLDMMLKMYPQAPWTDLTDGKVLDAERNG